MREATHKDPIWRDRADFIVAARLAPNDSGVATEQLWVRRVGDQTFEICCIPFFAYDLCLGDLVESDQDFTVVRVIERSERFVFRVWFGDSFSPRQPFVDRLRGLGALIEWSSPNLIALDAKDASLAETLATLLQQLEDQDVLAYETGRTV